MKKYRMQLIFGLPILLFAMGMIACDTTGLIDVEPFGYAFFRLDNNNFYNVLFSQITAE